MSLTRPLELDKALTPPERRLDSAAVIDILLIALFISLLASRFVFAPGLTMGLDLELPESSEAALTHAPSDGTLTVVLSAKRDNAYFFNDSYYTLAGLEAMFADYPEANEGEDRILLLKVDRSVSAETLVHIFNLAKKAQFTHVHWAAESEKAIEGAN